MKYLKRFETIAGYNAAKPNLILPNVSLITENNKVEYNPSGVVPPTPSHDYSQDYFTLITVHSHLIAQVEVLAYQLMVEKLGLKNMEKQP